MSKVIVYRSQLLTYSQTFIKEQVLAYCKWKPVLVGERLVPGGLSLNGIEVRLLRPERESPLQWGEHMLFRWLGHAPKRYASMLQAENADLVHVHFGTDATDIWPVVRVLNLPMVVTLHGYDINRHRTWWETGQGGLRRRIYPRKLLALAREDRVHFIAVSGAIRKRAIEYGIPADKITVCYIGVDTERFKPDGLPITQRAPRVLFVGRLVEQKGVTYLIQAFARVAEQIPNAELNIVGDGPLRAQLEVQARCVKARIDFLGALSSDQVKQQMDEARVFCLPSITIENGESEGFGLVLLEAQACGIPVISSALGGSTVGILHGETGYAFRERDMDALYRHLLLLLSNDELAHNISLAAPIFVEKRFNISKCMEVVENVYSKCL